MPLVLSTIEQSVILTYEVASGVGSGTSVLGWNTYPLNTKVLDTNNICTLSNNQFTLLPGKYKLIEVALRRFCINGVRFGHHIRLRNITDSQDVPDLLNQGQMGAINNDIVLSTSGTFTLTSSKTLEFQVYASAQSSAAWGNGGAVPGYKEIYGIVRLIKVT